MSVLRIWYYVVYIFKSKLIVYILFLEHYMMKD